jgi:hypothetical protein
VAQEVATAAAETTGPLGGMTVHDGLRRLRLGGRVMPSALMRRVRTLDGAWSLLRHPGAATSTVEKLKAWLDSDAAPTATPSSTDPGDGAAGGAEPGQTDDSLPSDGTADCSAGLGPRHQDVGELHSSVVTILARLEKLEAAVVTAVAGRPVVRAAVAVQTSVDTRLPVTESATASAPARFSARDEGVGSPCSGAAAAPGKPLAAADDANVGAAAAAALPPSPAAPAPGKREPGFEAAGGGHAPARGSATKIRVSPSDASGAEVAPTCTPLSPAALAPGKREPGFEAAGSEHAPARVSPTRFRAPPSRAPSAWSRPGLMAAVFDAFDRDADGYLSKQEMLAFSRRIGFDGSEAEWEKEYASLCRDFGCDADLGIEEVAFFMVLDDDQLGCLMSDDDLRALLHWPHPSEVARQSSRASRRHCPEARRREAVASRRRPPHAAAPG